MMLFDCFYLEITQSRAQKYHCVSPQHFLYSQ